MKIYLIRHGETDWNLQGRLQGREDIELNETGRIQAGRAKEALRDTGVRVVLTSPLIRAVETAKIISEGLAGSDVIIDEDLIEREFGILSGMSYDRRKYFDTFGREEKSMEPFDELCKRLLDCIYRNIEKYKDQDIIMVSHGAAINAVLSVLSGGDEGSGKTRLKNSCISTLTYEDSKLKIESFNLSPDEFMVMTMNSDIADRTEKIYNTVDSDKYAVAVDTGTTTLVLSLLSLSDGNAVGEYIALNPQRKYGTDVISRIKASNEGKRDLLMQLIRHEILLGIRHLIDKHKISFDRIDKIVIAGNTTMIHLFMGYSCHGLGLYPYTPINLKTINTSTDKIFCIEEKIPIILLPGISTFVGGDIASGLLACDFDHKNEICMFIDLGTNGEMAIGNKDKILVTSTAAGPAFEGVNVSCGVGSIPGAINHITLEGGRLSYETIEDEKPVGLCGTGIIELVSELLKEGIIDETGLLEDPYFDRGFVLADFSFSQQDVRQLQMAKAAIRAGTEILVNLFGTSLKELDKVYIAGSFGYHLDIEKAVRIGLLPELVANKVKGTGNTSILGASQVARKSDNLKRLEHIISITKEIHLSNDDNFNKLYIQNMLF
ncbi:MAG: DUF4445 domain-containing protein [Clostridiales bacterium]|nr:DUF4445 domain-containing protein [Clostridiales bacterium]